MDKRFVLCAVGCLCILLAPGSGIAIGAEAACAAGLIFWGKAFHEAKIQDYVAALLLQQILLALNSIWLSHILAANRQAEPLPGIGGKALWLIGLVASYVVCVAAGAWLREKLCRDRERNIVADRCKYIGAFFVMLLGEVSDGGAIMAVVVFLLLLITDARYYRMEGYQVQKLLLPAAAAIFLVIAWISAVDYMQVSIWQIEGFPQRLQEGLTVASSVGIAYVLLLFCDTFQGKGLPSRKA